RERVRAGEEKGGGAAGLHMNTRVLLALWCRGALAVSRPAARWLSLRGGSLTSFTPDLDASLLTTETTETPRERLPKEQLEFGKSFSDHMLEVDWEADKGWTAPRIHPFQDLKISPAASALHYGIEAFEGMKAYLDPEGKVRLFRPDLNLKRLNTSLVRLNFPQLDEEEFLRCLSALILQDKASSSLHLLETYCANPTSTHLLLPILWQDWVPSGEGFSLYIRPTVISSYPYLGVGPSKQMKLFVITSPTGSYFKGGFKPVRLYADTKHVRAWPGGTGYAKLGANYAPTIMPAEEARKRTGCSQILWLHGPERHVTEGGAMNVFFVFEASDGTKELVTPPLSSMILPGVTRQSILELAREWDEDGLTVSERELTMAEVKEAAREGKLSEVFCSGTGAVISPVGSILYEGEELTASNNDDIGPTAKRLWDELLAIQYGKVDHEWSVKLE
ncbi:unnamed protein product, partial [Chrysoparadoxa australica]